MSRGLDSLHILNDVSFIAFYGLRLIKLCSAVYSAFYSSAPSHCLYRWLCVSLCTIVYHCALVCIVDFKLSFRFYAIDYGILLLSHITHPCLSYCISMYYWILRLCPVVFKEGVFLDTDTVLNPLLYSPFISADIGRYPTQPSSVFVFEVQIYFLHI